MCAVLGIFQCTFHIPCMCCVLCLVAQSCLTLCDPMGYSPPGSCLHGDSPGKNTRVGCHALQRIFKTQGSNPGLLYCRCILYHLSYQRSPRILEWVTYPFSRESSWPRNRGRVSFSCRQILYELSYQGSYPMYSSQNLQESWDSMPQTPTQQWSKEMPPWLESSIQALPPAPHTPLCWMVPITLLSLETEIAPIKSL